MSIITDNTVLVHIYSGLESKNKITLGLLVALTAEKNDHKVTLFLAGDGVQILNCKKAGEIVGQGTGDLYEHLQNLKNSKITVVETNILISFFTKELITSFFSCEFNFPCNNPTFLLKKTSSDKYLNVFFAELKFIFSESSMSGKIT